MGFLELKKRVSKKHNKNDQKSLVLNPNVENKSETVSFKFGDTEYTYNIVRDKNSPNYFEPIYQDGELIEIIKAKKINKKEQHYYHYRNFEDLLNLKSYASEYYTTQPTDLGYIKTTRFCIYNDQVINDDTGENELNICQEIDKKENVSHVIYKGNRFTLEDTHTVTKYYPDGVSFGWAMNMSQHTNCLIDETSSKLSSTINTIFEKSSIVTDYNKNSTYFDKNSSIRESKSGNEILYKEIKNYIATLKHSKEDNSEMEY